MIGSPGGSFITQSCILLGQSALFDYTDTLGVYKGDFFWKKTKGRNNIFNPSNYQVLALAYSYFHKQND
jgi:hypothetical protein